MTDSNAITKVRNVSEAVPQLMENAETTMSTPDKTNVQKQSKPVSETVEVKEFVLKDALGPPRAVLGCGAGNDRHLAFLDEQGRNRLQVSLHGEKREPALTLRGDNNGNEKIALGLTEWEAAPQEDHPLTGE